MVSFIRGMLLIAHTGRAVGEHKIKAFLTCSDVQFGIEMATK